MKCALVTWGRRLLSAGLLLSLGTGLTLGQDVDATFPFSEAPFAREPSEIERYLLVRGQEPQLPPRQPLDLPLRQPIDVPSRPSISPDLEFAFQGESRPAGATGVERSNLVNVGEPDIAQALQQSPTGQSTNVRRLSPVSQNPYVRGYGIGQIYSVADGVYWTSARADLDSIMNKNDPSLVDRVELVPGPYGLRYGPGFAFIDVVMAQTPRYEGGYETHNRIGLNVRTNGGQVYGTDTIYGGAQRYGYSVTYGHRVGSDYDAGNGLLIPASYNVGNLLGQVGFDLSDDSRVEFRYQYMSEADTEYAAQFFDVDSLVTNAFALSYTKGRPDDAARLEANVWYHGTDFSGDTLNASKRLSYFPVLQRVDQAIANIKVKKNDKYEPVYGTLPGTNDYFRGFTEGDLSCVGARGALILEPLDDVRIRTGADFRLIDQAIVENYDLQPVAGPMESFTTNLPRSSLVDPGLYAEASLGWTSFWKMTFGGRFDWAYTTARDPQPQATGNSIGQDLDQSEPLFAAYLSNAVDINTNWTTHVSVGYSEIVPDLFQRYANGVFLGMIQSGFSRVIGNPALPKERLLQADVDVEAHYDRFQGRAAFFYGWLCDYATYAANIIPDPTGARLLYAVETERASMTGFELYGEYDVLPWLTPFGSARYVQGEDGVIDQPLPQIAPLEGTVGIRVEPVEAASPWGVELGLRMVDRQDRDAWVRSVLVSGVVQVEDPTPGFTTAYLRAYYSPKPNLHIIGGVENLFDRAYIEHLNLRLPASGPFVQTPVLSPGITPYIAVEWTL